MSSSETERLNFYSKYNRVRERQDIDSLYALIDTGIDQALVFTLASSRVAAPAPPPPPIQQQVTAPLLPSLVEQQEQERRRAVQDKLRKLEQMQRNFHQQLQRSQREQRKKEQAREAKRKERENYRHHLINVVEHTSENSHPEPQPTPPSPEPAPPVDDYDDYYCGVQVELEVKEESEFDVRETRRKLKEIIEMQRRREREVESVEQNNDNKAASSIVIERLAIAPKHTPQPPAPKETRNYCEVELSHSQSANVLRSVRSEERLDFKEHIAEEQKEDPYSPVQMHYEEVNLNYEAEEEMPEQEESDLQDEPQLVEQEQEQEEEPQSQADYAYEYEQSQGVDPPLTHTQNDNPLTAEDASQLSEEIADHVVSIGDLSEQQSQPPQHNVHKGPLFHSQAHPKYSFHSQQEVQSIAESIDYHPLQGQGDRQLAHDHDRKTSFKKLMAENRANLIPRLAISTILNEHINEALAGPPPALPPPALHESIISSEGSTGRAAKVNFKSLLRRNKPTTNSRIEVPRDPVKAQANKNLLLSFFDQN